MIKTINRFENVWIISEILCLRTIPKLLSIGISFKGKKNCCISILYMKIKVYWGQHLT